jgi:hypothetical protein
MKVLFLPEVQGYYDNLEQILYEKGYFSFPNLSKKYVKDLIKDIKTALPVKHHKPAPRYFDKYGTNMKYASFRKNRHTTWYAFFTTYENNCEIIYLVRYISNNHVIAQYL